MTNSTTAANTRDGFGFLARGDITFDARQNTAYGVLRSYIDIQSNNGQGFESSGVYTDLNLGYVQWAGITAGRVGSFFSYLAGGELFDDFMSPDRTGSNQPDLLAYTATFGGGFSATVSIEDPTGARANGAGTGAWYGANTYFGERYPDVIAALRVDQGWGSAQLSGVAHNTHVLGAAGDTEDKWGYAVLGGVTVNLPALGPGDKIALQGVYSNRAAGYSGLTSPSYAVGDQGLNMNGNGTIFQVTDAYDNGGGKWSTPTAYTIAGFIEHHFSPVFWSALEGSYGNIQYSGAPTTISKKADGYFIGGIVHWDPVAHLDFALELAYESIHQTTPTAFVALPGKFVPCEFGWLPGSLLRHPRFLIAAPTAPPFECGSGSPPRPGSHDDRL